MLDLSKPMRVKSGGQQVRFTTMIRTKGWGPMALCIMDDGDYDLTIVVDPDTGAMKGHPTYTRVENYPETLWVDLHDDGSLSEARTSERRGAAPSFIDQKEIVRTFKLTPLTGEIE